MPFSPGIVMSMTTTSGDSSRRHLDRDPGHRRLRSNHLEVMMLFQQAVKPLTKDLMVVGDQHGRDFRLLPRASRPRVPQHRLLRSSEACP